MRIYDRECDGSGRCSHTFEILSKYWGMLEMVSGQSRSKPRPPPVTRVPTEGGAARCVLLDPSTQSHPDYSPYPFDKHHLHVDVSSMSYTPERITLSVDTDFSGIALEEQDRWPGWEYVKGSFHVLSTMYEPMWATAVRNRSAHRLAHGLATATSDGSSSASSIDTSCSQGLLETRAKVRTRAKSCMWTICRADVMPRLTAPPTPASCLYACAYACVCGEATPASCICACMHIGICISRAGRPHADHSPWQDRSYQGDLLTGHPPCGNFMDGILHHSLSAHASNRRWVRLLPHPDELGK